MGAGDRQPVRVVAVHADATPVPTGSVVPAAPVVGRVRVVAVPACDQRSRRTPVVGPHAQIVAVVHEVAVDVVVPAAGPEHLGIGLDRLLVRVHVGHHGDLAAVGEGLVADDAVVTRLLVDLLDVDVVVGTRLGDHGARRGIGIGSRAVSGMGVPIRASAHHAQARRQHRRAPPLPCTLLHSGQSSLRIGPHQDVDPPGLRAPRDVRTRGIPPNRVAQSPLALRLEPIV